MVKPIPDNVKDILNELTAAQQVVLRSYIASLRSDIVSMEEAALNATVGEDSHAHYHGHELCTADHGPGAHETDDPPHEHKHTEHCEHEHKHTEHCGHEKEDHEHKHTEHCEHDHEHHEHKHDHHKDHDHHEHKHDHHEHKHEHKHDHHKDHKHDHHKDHKHDHHQEESTKEEDVPAWKKAALSADPSAAPFGGNWHSESNISATSGQGAAEPMEEA